MTTFELGQARAVLFDLDGTLVDTAPDMARVLADMLASRGIAAPPYETMRSYVSNGSLGLVQLGFPDLDARRQRDLQDEYLQRYEAEVCRDSSVFPGLLDLLERLERAGCEWGIVTNKPQRMTRPLLEQLGLAERSACAVSGDTLMRRKPHPEPLLYACRVADMVPKTTIYVGDAERDIVAGRAAGMPTIAASYGYITADDDARRWQADAIAASTEELVTIIEKAVSLPT